MSHEQVIIWDKAEATVGKISRTVAIGMDNSLAIQNQLNRYEVMKNGFKFNTENNPDSVNQVLKIFIGMGWQAWNNQHPEKPITAEEFAANPKKYQALFQLREKEESMPLNFANISEFVFQLTTGVGGKTYVRVPPLSSNSAGLEYQEITEDVANKKGKLILYVSFSIDPQFTLFMNDPNKYPLKDGQLKYYAGEGLGLINIASASIVNVNSEKTCFYHELSL